MDIIHEYGVFCEYTVQYVVYTVDVCIIYSVVKSLLATISYQKHTCRGWKGLRYLGG